MFNSESDDYQLEKTEKLIIENLYQNNVFIGRKKTIKQTNGYYREIVYNDKNQIVSDKQYSVMGYLIKGKIYTDGKMSHHIETDIDSSGFRHEVVMDTKHQIVSHSKFDKLGRYVGCLVYENGKVIGQKELKYSDKGEITEIVRNEKYKVILERKLNPKHNKSETETKAVIVERHEITTDNNGRNHEIVYDANNTIIADKELPQHIKPMPALPAQKEIKPLVQKKSAQNNKIIAFLCNLLHLHR